MTIAALRSAFNVPAKVGGRVLYAAANGAEFKGTIRGVNRGSTYLKVLMDGERSWRYAHPVNEVTYLDAKGNPLAGEAELIELSPAMLAVMRATLTDRVSTPVRRTTTERSPLRVGNFDPYALFTCRENGPFRVAKAETKAIARRLVACWNYCQNIDTAVLEQGAVK